MTNSLTKGFISVSSAIKIYLVRIPNTIRVVVGQHLMMVRNVYLNATILLNRLDSFGTSICLVKMSFSFHGIKISVLEKGKVTLHKDASIAGIFFTTIL